MSRTLLYISFLLAMALFTNYACKHKKEQVVAVQRTPVKKPPVKVNSTDSKPTSTNSNSSELQQKLGISAKQVKDSKFYSFIDAWYGTPYKYSGCQKSGIDCSCFTNLLYDEVYNKKIPRSSSEMFKASDLVSLEDAKVGDLLFFKIGGSSISHVGIYIWGKLFVHASTSKGVIINSLDEAYYKKYFFSAGKLKNI